MLKKHRKLVEATPSVRIKQKKRKNKTKEHKQNEKYKLPNEQRLLLALVRLAAGVENEHKNTRKNKHQRTQERRNIKERMNNIKKATRKRARANPYLLLHHQAPRWSGVWAATKTLVQHGGDSSPSPPSSLPLKSCTAEVPRTDNCSGGLPWWVEVHLSCDALPL